jgi:hypothetical protein
VAQSHGPIQLRRCLAKPRQRFRHRLRHLDSQDCLCFVRRNCSRPGVPAHRNSRRRYSNTNPNSFDNADTDANGNGDSDTYSYTNTNCDTQCNTQTYSNTEISTDASASPDTAAIDAARSQRK